MKRALPTLILIILLILPAVFAQPKHITVLSVSERNETVGGIADVFLEIRPGSGGIYLDSLPLTKLDTQISTRFAKEYACSLAKKDCSRLDFFYVIRAPTTIIGGPSAGGSLTVLTYAALENLNLREDTVMTGTINSGGLIGPVGGVQEKVWAAYNEGFSRVLVPQLDMNDTWVLPPETEVLAIVDVEDAIYYFTGEDLRTTLTAVEVPAQYTQQMEAVAEALCTRTNRMREQVNNVSNSTQRFLDNAVQASGEQNYYSSASYCFSAGLTLRQQILEDYEQHQRQRIYRQLQLDIEELDNSLPEDITSIADLEVYMIVRERLVDSYQRLEREDFENITVGGLGYSIERYNSALVWSSFLGKIPSKELDLSEEQLKRSCEQKLAEADERINYVTYIIGSELKDTKQELDNAFEDKRQGEYTLCIFKASKAKAEANSVISTVYSGSSMNDSVQRKVEKAGSLLGEQTREGNFPILAYSYYEYAQNLDDLFTANLYAEYSLELGTLDIYFPAREPHQEYELTKVWLLIGGLFVGLGFGVFFTELFHHRKQKRKKR